MGQTILSLLVGLNFRPPALAVIQHLPGGTPLVLEPEPDNPYDDQAIRVLVSPSSVPKDEYGALAEDMLQYGETLETWLMGGLCHLGYVAKSGGKPLLQAGISTGNKEFMDLILGGPDRPGPVRAHSASLGTTPGGQWAVVLHVEESQA